MQEIIKQIIKERQLKNKKNSESLAKLIESYEDAKINGNTRKANALKKCIDRIKRGKK